MLYLGINENDLVKKEIERQIKKEIVQKKKILSLIKELSEIVSDNFVCEKCFGEGKINFSKMDCNGDISPERLIQCDVCKGIQRATTVEDAQIIMSDLQKMLDLLFIRIT